VLEDGLSLASATPGDRLVVDVSCVTFMDAAGLRVVAAAHARRVAAGRAGLVVRGASGTVRRVFDVTGLSVLLEARESMRQCDAATVDGRRGELESARRRGGLSVAELFVAYFALGGTADRGQLVAYLNGDAEALDRHQRDIAAHALNERLGDVGRSDQLLSYASA